MSTKIGFSTSNKILSRVIRTLTSSTVSHAWLLYFDTDFNAEYVMEATFGGFRIIRFDHFKKKNIIVDVVEPKVSIDAGLAAVAELLGSSDYDVGGLIGMGWVRLMSSWFKKKVANPFASRRAMFCSEAVALALRLSNMPGAEKLDPETTSPEDLRDFLKAS